MSLTKCKLVLRTSKGQTKVGGPVVDTFVIAKSVNTLEFGIPGDELTREEVDRILKVQANRIRSNKLNVEFIT